jgi:hypothetical protein
MLLAFSVDGVMVFDVVRIHSSKTVPWLVIETLEQLYGIK